MASNSAGSISRGEFSYYLSRPKEDHLLCVTMQDSGEGLIDLEMDWPLLKEMLGFHHLLVFMN